MADWKPKDDPEVVVSEHNWAPTAQVPCLPGTTNTDYEIECVDNELVITETVMTSTSFPDPRGGCMTVTVTLRYHLHTGEPCGEAKGKPKRKLNPQEAADKKIIEGFAKRYKDAPVHSKG